MTRKIPIISLKDFETKSKKKMVMKKNLEIGLNLYIKLYLVMKMVQGWVFLLVFLVLKKQLNLLKKK